MSIVFPELATARLRLTPFCPEDSRGLFELWRQEEVCRYSGAAFDLRGAPIVLPARSAADSDGILEFFIERARLATGVRWTVRTNSGDFVGALGFNSMGACPELAFHQVPAHWGRGYMSQACPLIMGWARETLGAVGFEAFVDPLNTASERLLTRLGFEAEDHARDGARRWLHGVDTVDGA